MSVSEVARLRQELEQRAYAARMGLSGLAMVARHQTITKRMEHMTQTFQALVEVVGEEQAMQIWIETENLQEGEVLCNQLNTVLPPQEGDVAQ